MNVLLKPELERFVAEKVHAGQYADPSAMVNEALEVLKEREEFSPEHKAYLQREIARGIEELDRGERARFDVEEIIAEAHRRAAGKKES